MTKPAGVKAAIDRLRRAAEARRLMAYGDFKYGGSIAEDILTVLDLLGQADEKGRYKPWGSRYEKGGE